MFKLRSTVLMSTLALAGSVFLATGAAACDRDCGCSDNHHLHRHHAMRSGHDHMHAMRHERAGHYRFADGGESEQRVVFMRFRRDERGPHERFNVWYGHPHHFAMAHSEGCGGEMEMHGHHGMHERHAWVGREGGEMAMGEWREHRHHFDRDRDGEEEHHRHHRGFDPYRDSWESRGNDSDGD